MLSDLQFGTLLTLLAANLFSQDFNQFYCLGKQQGMPSNKITTIQQDDEGFLWLGTDRGLVRYDGSQLRIYTADDASIRLRDNSIHALVADGSHLWIGHYSGLSRMNLHRDDITHIQLGHSPDAYGAEAISSVHKDRTGRIWIGTKNQGFGYYQPAFDSIILFQLSLDQLADSSADFQRSNEVLSFQLDIHSDSLMWVGTYGGLIKFNVNTHALRHYYFEAPTHLHQGSANAMRFLYQSRQGDLYAATWNAGLNRIIPHQNKLIPALAAIPGQNDQFFIPIRKVLEKSPTEIWVTNTVGLATFNLISRSYTSFQFHQQDAEIKFGIDFIDRDGRIYLETINEGVRIFDPDRQQFQSYSFASHNKEGGGYVYDIDWSEGRQEYYLSTRGGNGIYKYSLESDQWTVTKPEAGLYFMTQLSMSNMIALDQNRYLVSSYGGLFEYEPAHNSTNISSLTIPNDIERCGEIFKDSKEQIWLATNRHGIYRCDEGGRFKPFYDHPEYDLHLNISNVFFEDKKGNIFIKNAHGFRLLRFDGVFFDLLEDHIEIPRKAKFVEDKLGRIWIPFNGHSLGFISSDQPDQGIIQHYSLARLGELRHLDMSTDGYLWCLTSDNLVKINLSGEILRIVNFKYGLDVNQFFSFSIDDNNMATLGGSNQIIRVNLNTLSPDTDLPKPYITDINVKQAPLESELAYRKIPSLVLKPSENFFSIGFSALGMSFGESNNYRYRLRGFQDEWIENGTRSFANFTNVPSGSYLFELQAANSEQRWNPELCTLPIDIAEPFWQKTGVQLLALVLFSLLGYALYRRRIHKIRRSEQKKAAYQKRLNSVEMSALRAQMNPHFIFNCLNSIENYIVKNDTVNASNYLNDFARLIRLILQNSRAKFVTLSQELEAIELYLQMESLRFDHKFEYSITIDQSLDPRSLEIPPMLIQPYVENAIWHGLMHKASKGNLTLDIRRSNGSIKCSIIDDGIGREESARINANKFKRPKESYGMIITKDRIDVINTLYDIHATVEVIDLRDGKNKPAGTRVDLKIPII